MINNCWGESFYISSSIAPPSYLGTQWDFALQFMSSFSVTSFLDTLPDFDMRMLCHRFTRAGQLDPKFIESEIYSGQLKVHPEIKQTNFGSQDPIISCLSLSGAIHDFAQKEKRSLITIRSEIKMTLRQIVDQERIEAKKIDEKYRKQSAYEKTRAHVNSVANGLYKSSESFLTWIKEVNDVISLNQRLLRVMKAASATENYDESKRYQVFQQTLAESEKKELVEALGFDPVQISLDKLKQAYELASMIYDDHLTQLILIQFVKDYADVQHNLEWSGIAGDAAFEIVLTALLAIVTGSVGAVASIGAKARQLDQIKKLGKLFTELADELKKIPKGQPISLKEAKKKADKKSQGKVGTKKSSNGSMVDKRAVPQGAALEYQKTRGTYKDDLESSSPLKNNSTAKFQNLKSMDPDYLAEDLGMAKAWEPFGAEVEYLTPEELSKFEVKVVDNKLIDAEGTPVDSGHTNNGKVMFVMDQNGKIYTGEQRIMEFHHSSFLAGNDVASAGELMVLDGQIISHNRKSGHYKPTPEQHGQFISEMQESGIDLSKIPEDVIE